MVSVQQQQIIDLYQEHIAWLGRLNKSKKMESEIFMVNRANATTTRESSQNMSANVQRIQSKLCASLDFPQVQTVTIFGAARTRSSTGTSCTAQELMPG